MSARTIVEIAAPEYVRLDVKRLVHDTVWLRGRHTPTTLDMPRMWEWKDRTFDVVEATELWWSPSLQALIGRTSDRALYVGLDEADGGVKEHYIFKIVPKP